MSRLVNRQLQIPGGYKFYQPETGWNPSAWSSFDSIVQQVISHRKGNPALAATRATDVPSVESEVDAFNALICEKMGWGQYIAGGEAAPPKSPPPPSLFNRVKRVAAGADTVVTWIQSGAEAVSDTLSNHRAEICAGCPQNLKAALSDIFTVGASEAIRAALNKRKEMNLSTLHDENLGVCDACSCPLKLKVHMPIASIITKIPAEARARLDPRCWITFEAKG